MRSGATRPTQPSPLSGEQLLRSVVARAGWWLVPLLLLTVSGAAAELVLPAALGHAVDRVSAASQTANPDWSSARDSLFAVAALLGFGVAVEASTGLLGGIATARSTGALRRRILRHIVASGPALTQHAAAGDLVARLGNGASLIAKACTVVTGLAATAIPAVGGAVALAIIDPWLAVAFFAGMVSISGIVRTYLRDARQATAGYLQDQGAIAARLVDALGGIRTIAAARTTEREVERILQPLAGLRRHGQATWENLARLAFQGEPAVLLTQVAVLGVAGLGVSTGRLSPGELLAASRYALMATGLGSMLDELAWWSRALASADRVAQIWAEPSTIHGDQDLPPGPGTLEFHAVTAGPADNPVVRDLQLTIPGGRVTALVGRSGTGKSLVAALAGRLCDPRRGEVTLDGVPLERLDRQSLRDGIAYAFDVPALLGGTVAGAISFGTNGMSADEIGRAAQAAHADQFIERLPRGYATALADAPMSGGEVQRIGLARAFLRCPRVLILDDAMSSLDTATEAEIAKVLTTQVPPRTRLIVTHRAATAARADLVAWLDEGRLRALGTHRQLWANRAYRAAFLGVEAAGVADEAEAVPAAVGR